MHRQLINNISEYRLGNFKAFGETVSIPLRPITLIFGANSSGKSSIIQSLLLLKQTVDTLDKDDPFSFHADAFDFRMAPLKSEGLLIDLGPYSEFVHRHETERAIEFGAGIGWEAFAASLDLFYCCPGWREVCESTGIGDGGIVLNTQYADQEGTYIRREKVFVGDDQNPVLTRELTEDAIPADWYTANINSESQYWFRWWKALKKRLDNSKVTEAEKGILEVKQIVKEYDDAVRLLRTGVLHFALSAIRSRLSQNSLNL